MEDKKPELDEYEQSAAMFNMLSKRFRGMCYDLTTRKKRAVSRVLEALLFEPLEEIELSGKEEKELLDLSRQIIYHKMKIHEYALITNNEGENKNG